jgi:hypothetical protein
MMALLTSFYFPGNYQAKPGGVLAAQEQKAHELHSCGSIRLRAARSAQDDNSYLDVGHIGPDFSHTSPPG